MDEDVPNSVLSNSFEPHVNYRCNLTNGYSSLKLHDLMWRDRFTRLFCNEVILKNKHLFKDKVVLDVDCGTGLISMLIASQGAKTVIGIEASPRAELARQAIQANNVENVCIIQDDINEIKSLPDDITEVDVIVSQWMGFLLFDTKLLSRLIKARDRWLKPSGIMMPDCIRLFITAAECGSRKQELSNSLELDDFDSKAFKSTIFELPQCEIVPASKVMTDSFQLGVVNLKTVCDEKLSLSNEFKLNVFNDSFIHAFVLYFQIGFTKCHKHVYISSSPYESPSLWKQMLLYFDNRLHGRPGEVIYGTFDLAEEERHGDLHFNVKVNFMGSVCSTLFYNTYKLKNQNLIPDENYQYIVFTKSY